MIDREKGCYIIKGRKERGREERKERKREREKERKEGKREGEREGEREGGEGRVLVESERKGCKALQWYSRYIL